MRVCGCLRGGGYVFTCLSPLAHDSVGSLGRQGRFYVHSIFNLFVPLNRDTCLLTDGGGGGGGGGCVS